jgi:hypothetical protein
MLPAVAADCCGGGFGAVRRSARCGRTSFITYIAPIVAIGAGCLVRAEPVTVRPVLGTALVLLGAVLAARRPVGWTGRLAFWEAQASRLAWAEQWTQLLDSSEELYVSTDCVL